MIASTQTIVRNIVSAAGALLLGTVCLTAALGPVSARASAPSVATTASLSPNVS